jgi:hypothetical protein
MSLTQGYACRLTLGYYLFALSGQKEQDNLQKFEFLKNLLLLVHSPLRPSAIERRPDKTPPDSYREGFVLS